MCPVIIRPKSGLGLSVYEVDISISKSVQFVGDVWYSLADL